MNSGKKVDALTEADTYLRFGRRDQAEMVLEKAIQENPQRRELQEALNEIRRKPRSKAIMSLSERFIVFFLVMLAAATSFFGRDSLLMRGLGMALGMAAIFFVVFCVVRRIRNS